MRLIVGGFMFTFGLQKLMAGQDKLIWLGHQMKHLGIDFFPLGFGVMAALTELLGGLLLILGYYTRVAAFFLIFVMVVASLTLINGGGDLTKISHPMITGAVFLCLLFTGPGKYSVKG